MLSSPLGKKKCSNRRSCRGWAWNTTSALRLRSELAPLSRSASVVITGILFPRENSVFPEMRLVLHYISRLWGDPTRGLLPPEKIQVLQERKEGENWAEGTPTYWSFSCTEQNETNPGLVIKIDKKQTNVAAINQNVMLCKMSCKFPHALAILRHFVDHL